MTNYAEAISILMAPSEWFQFPKKLLKFMTKGEVIFFGELMNQYRLQRIDENRWFPVSAAIIEKELGMGTSVQCRAVTKLVKLGVLETKVRENFPRQRCFRIVWDGLVDLLSKPEHNEPEHEEESEHNEPEYEEPEPDCPRWEDGHPADRLPSVGKQTAHAGQADSPRWANILLRNNKEEQQRMSATRRSAAEPTTPPLNESLGDESTKDKQLKSFDKSESKQLKGFDKSESKQLKGFGYEAANSKLLQSFGYKAANKLAMALVEKNKLYKTPKLQQWAKTIDKFLKSTTITEDRFKELLRWYIGHIGEPYVPEAYCADSFCMKFAKIESSRRREEVDSRRDGDNGSMLERTLEFYERET